MRILRDSYAALRNGGENERTWRCTGDHKSRDPSGPPGGEREKGIAGV